MGRGGVRKQQWAEGSVCHQDSSWLEPFHLHFLPSRNSLGDETLFLSLSISESAAHKQERLGKVSQGSWFEKMTWS